MKLKNMSRTQKIGEQIWSNKKNPSLWKWIS